MNTPVFHTDHRIRFVTAASLFDGHDASINIFRRILQQKGAEVIHLGHNRSVEEVVRAAIQENVQGVAVSSYQGGHMEYFKYLRQLLNERGGAHIKIFGGGGGVIVAEEIAELEANGIEKIFSPEDGRSMGLDGIIESMLLTTDFDPAPSLNGSFEDLGRLPFSSQSEKSLATALSFVENHNDQIDSLLASKRTEQEQGIKTPVIGITGPGGAGKSSLTDEIILRFMENNKDLKVGIIAMDPTRRKTGGALLGDRIRMNSPALFPDRIFFRSMATRTAHRSISESIRDAIILYKMVAFDLIIVETSGTGQSDSEIVDLVDLNLYVMTPEFGAPTQLEKIQMLDFADIVALNKSEKQGALDALHHVKKQFQRNHQRFDQDPENMPVYPTIAGRFNDEGIHRLYNALIAELEKISSNHYSAIDDQASTIDTEIIPPSRIQYLSDVSDGLRSYREEAMQQASLAEKLQSIEMTLSLLKNSDSNQTLETNNNFSVSEPRNAESTLNLTTESNHFQSEHIQALKKNIEKHINPELLAWLRNYPALKESFSQDTYSYEVREKEIKINLKKRTLSGLDLPLLALPDYHSWRELTLFYYKENVPGSFPFTAGVFPFRKTDEDPTRMFAGEGGPEQTNRRFHYLASGQKSGARQATRLSTAFDSVTLYGEDPDERPDIFGKIGNSGVSVPTLDDCKRLYSGFDLLHPSTSVSMTINGPAPTMLAFFFNTAIDQAVEKHLHETGKLEAAKNRIHEIYREKDLPAPVYEGDLPAGHNGSGLLLGGATDQLGEDIVSLETYAKIKAETMSTVRGTVQADILKEDQAQNTCIFSTAFALKMMGDIQQYFTENNVRNFYSVSISGYHIAEAGANPITQLAFTLANGLTYVEYYRKRGIPIDAFAPNLSFFFSNGLDAEYSVIGRVARRIWSVAMKRIYGGSERSQKLKYHIQTSGRSLHAMEIDFNDIRTTLQALYALYDNCNSLHTNAYDEAITTPTEQSVRRAVAIQLIINRELGLNQNHNPVQGAYIIGELTDLVEEAVLAEFDRITERGGVLGAMETMYQRSKIQEESLYYEHQKHSGELPIVGINTFLSDTKESTSIAELIRSSDQEKQRMIERTRNFEKAFTESSDKALRRLKHKAVKGENIFSELMECVKVASLGRISAALYQVGGSYRRNI